MQNITFPVKLTETQIIMTTGYACRYSPSKTNQKLKFEKYQHFLCPYEEGCVGQAPTPADLSHTIIFFADAQDPTNNDHWVRPLRQHHIIWYDVNTI